MTPAELDARHFQLILEAAPIGMVAIGTGGQILLLNARAEKLFGYERAELIGRSVDCLLPPEARELHSRLRTEYMRAPETRPMGVGRELYAQRRDGTRFPVEIGLNPVQTNTGSMVIATVLDITERKRSEEHKELLVGELNHRTKNLFAVMQATAMHTLRGGRDVIAARDAFLGQLMSLARAYSVLMDKSWTGAPLDDLLRLELFSFSDKIEIAGPTIMVRPAATQSFAMLFHELATNAAKHGAFSTAEGRVAVCWRLKDGQRTFSLDWIESGGPRVAARPTRRGYGHRVLEEVGRHLGRCDIRFAPDGFTYHLQADLAQIGAAAG